jgi:hypothetical protein
MVKHSEGSCFTQVFERDYAVLFMHAHPNISRGVPISLPDVQLDSNLISHQYCTYIQLQPHPFYCLACRHHFMPSISSTGTSSARSPFYACTPHTPLRARPAQPR